MKQAIQMYTIRWCHDRWPAKRFLKRHGLRFEQVDIAEFPKVAEFIVRANRGKRRVPTFEMEGRFFHCSPFDPDLLGRELGHVRGSGDAGNIGLA